MPTLKSWLLYILLGLVTATTLVGAITLYIRLNNQQPLEILFVTPTPYVPALIKVYITGAVAREGVYPLQEGDRLEDALRAAGGPSLEADMEMVNLALKVKDEGHYHFPKKGEASAPSSAATTVPSASTGTRLNVNTATQRELEELPGIGQIRAKAIIEHRETNGPFQRPEDLLKVKGIGIGIYQQIKDRITVNP